MFAYHVIYASRIGTLMKLFLIDTVLNLILQEVTHP